MKKQKSRDHAVEMILYKIPGKEDKQDKLFEQSERRTVIKESAPRSTEA